MTDGYDLSETLVQTADQIRNGVELRTRQVWWSRTRYLSIYRSGSSQSHACALFVYKQYNHSRKRVSCFLVPSLPLAVDFWSCRSEISRKRKKCVTENAAE